MESVNKELISRVISGHATKKEAREVVEWFSTTPEGQACLSEMIHNDAHLLDAEGLEGFGEKSLSPILSQKILAEINRQIHRKTIRRLVMRVAAVLIPFVILAGFTFYTNSRVDLFGISEYSEIYIPKGEKNRILFQDGSQAFLNSDTKIRFPLKFGLTERRIQLEGEAYFKISTNSKRPFIVQMNDKKVKVTGTSFNVKAYKSDKTMNIVLDEGRISFLTPQNSYFLLPGQQAIYNNETGECTINSLEKSTEASLWVKDVLKFKDTPLPEVLKTLNRVFNVEFQIKNPEVYKYTYTLTTESTSLEKITKELEKIAPVRFRIQDDKVVSVTTK